MSEFDFEQTGEVSFTDMPKYNEAFAQVRDSLEAVSPPKAYIDAPEGGVSFVIAPPLSEGGTPRVYFDLQTLIAAGSEQVANQGMVALISSMFGEEEGNDDGMARVEAVTDYLLGLQAQTDAIVEWSQA